MSWQRTLDRLWRYWSITYQCNSSITVFSGDWWNPNCAPTVPQNSRWIWLLVKPLLYKHEMASAPIQKHLSTTYMKVVWKTSESDTVMLWGVSRIFKSIQHRAKWLKHQFMGNGKNQFLPFSKGVNTSWNIKLWGVARTSSCHFQSVSTQA